MANQESFTPTLYEGESLELIGRYPALFKFSPSAHSSAKNKPLMVFIPGAAHLARIAYGGHAGYNPKNFLSYWLNQAGFHVLAISYPLESTPTVVAPRYPDFRISAWGAQAARTTRMVVDENGLSDEVILLGWSMGGKILKPFSVAAQTCNLDIKLFVSLAATPGGITGLRSYPQQIQRTNAGYAACSVFKKTFLQQIHEQQKQEGGQSLIIDEEAYTREYFGHTPVRLTSWGLTYPELKDDARRIEESGFIVDEWEALRDAGPEDKDIKMYPFIGSIRPTSILDARHSLVDSANWGMVLTLKLIADVTKEIGSSPGIPSEVWQQIMDLVHSAPAQMTGEIVKGTHFFFLGETGARETVEAIVRLIGKMEQIKRQMEELFARSSC